MSVWTSTHCQLARSPQKFHHIAYSIHFLSLVSLCRKWTSLTSNPGDSWGKSDQIQMESIRPVCRQAQETKSEHGSQLEAQLEELRRLEFEKASVPQIPSLILVLYHSFPTCFLYFSQFWSSWTHFFVFVLLAGVCPQHWHQVNVSVWQSEGDAMVGRITKAFFQMTAAGFAGMFCWCFNHSF